MWISRCGEGNFDSSVLEGSKQRKVKVAAHLLRLNLLDVDPKQQFKVQAGVPKIREPHLGRRFRLNVWRVTATSSMIRRTTSGSAS